MDARPFWRRLPGPFTGPMKEIADMEREVEEFARQRRLNPEANPDPNYPIGAMREFADELDEIVEDAMRRRRAEATRYTPDE